MLSILASTNALSWIIEVDHGSESQGFTKSKVIKSQDSIKSKLKILGATQIQSISFIANLVKFEIAEDLFEQVSEIQGVRQIRKSETISPPKPVAVETRVRVNGIHDATKVKTAWDKYDVSGEGVLVGVIDTGIDYTHSAFQNEKNVTCVGSTGCKIVQCYDFTGELNKTDCMDTLGHGTHVAGIVLGKDDRITGVAPNAKLGVYKVFREGVQDEDYFQVYAALDQASKDGMNVVNLSLGLASGWDGGLIEGIYGKMEELGILIINANGNEGNFGLYMGGSPAVSKSAIAIAAFKTNSDNSFLPTSFTSWGPTPELKIKPEIAGPGQAILSSIPNSMCKQKSCYDSWSGTSMASPYIAGCAALYIEYFKSSKGFKSKAMQSASPSVNLNGSPHSIVQQGSGMINMDWLLSTFTVVEPNKIELGAVSKGQFKILTVTNDGTTILNLTFTHESAVSVHGDNRLVVSKSYNNTVKMRSEMSVYPGTQKKLMIWIQPDTAMDINANWVFSGYIKMTDDAKNVLRIPYAGFYGNYQSISIYPSDGSYPTFMANGKRYRNKSDVVVVSGSVIPRFAIKYVHPVEALQVQIVNKTDDKPLGLTHYETHIRNHDGEFEDIRVPSKVYDFKTYFENGKYCVFCYAVDKEMKEWKSIVNGEYYFVITAQKPLGKVTNKNDYVVWQSPLVIVNRTTTN